MEGVKTLWELGGRRALHGLPGVVPGPGCRAEKLKVSAFESFTCHPVGEFPRNLRSLKNSVKTTFPNAARVQEVTRKFAQTIRHIELKWGDDLGVDPITNEFAMVGVSCARFKSTPPGIALPKPDT